MDAVTMTDVVKDYGSVRALDGIDLRFEHGCITAVLGPNGAGKTTAIDLALGLRRPTSGTVRVLGRRPGHASVRPRVGAMLQDPGFPEATTSTELLRLVATAYPDPMGVPEVLDHVDLAGLGDRRIADLSGGQRQRVALAVAMVGRPDLLVFDEPTAALDVEARRRFWDRIRDLATTGHTVVFTTHHLAEADDVADHVVVIDDGRVLASGSPGTVRGLVAGRTIRLTTPLPTATLADLPGVRHVDESTGVVDGSRPVTLHATDAAAVVVALVEGGHDLDDLTIAEANLEDAFLHLTGVA